MRKGVALRYYISLRWGWGTYITVVEPRRDEGDGMRKGVALRYYISLRWGRGTYITVVEPRQ